MKTMTAEELLTRYAAGERDFQHANLAGENLYGVHLSEANLADADLTDTDLYGANLAGANLAGANLARADLRRAILFHANLTEANLTDTILIGVNLVGAILYQGDATKVKIDLSLLQTPSSPVWGQPRPPDALSGSRVVNGWLRTGYATGDGNGGER